MGGREIQLSHAIHFKSISLISFVSTFNKVVLHTNFASNEEVQYHWKDIWISFSKSYWKWVISVCAAFVFLHTSDTSVRILFQAEWPSPWAIIVVSVANWKGKGYSKKMYKSTKPVQMFKHYWIVFVFSP